MPEFEPEYGAVTRPCDIQQRAELVAVRQEPVATTSIPGVVVTAAQTLDASVDYAPFRLLAYSINDGGRASGQVCDDIPGVLLRRGRQFYPNGDSRPLPTAAFDPPGGGSVETDGQGRSGPRFLINWPGGKFTAGVNLYARFLNVGVDGKDGTYSGLIGNLDGNPNNDMLPRGGSALICPAANEEQLIAFGDSWRLTQEETLLRAELVEARVSLVTASRPAGGSRSRTPSRGRWSRTSFRSARARTSMSRWSC